MIFLSEYSIDASSFSRRPHKMMIRPLHYQFVSPTEAYSTSSNALKILEKNLSIKTTHLTMVSDNADGNDEYSNNDNNDNNPDARRGGRRVGGRSSKSNPKEVLSTEKDPPRGSYSLINFAGPILLCLIILSNFFNGLTTSYVYYESSVIQISSYDNQGQIKTVKKESIKSNIPGMKQRLREIEERKQLFNEWPYTP